jgi:hypothetical protein
MSTSKHDGHESNMPDNNGLQRTALRAAAEVER